ncbi:MAG: hypothetical protein N838_31075 [Thiohalocapsa sp. PB-PSB1]|nr:MAG: hypothetical protein N838_31075 [Thiohalocapsa sp. PB-PSB1]
MSPADSCATAIGVGIGENGEKTGMVGVHILRSMSLGLSAEMTLPRRDR